MAYQLNDKLRDLTPYAPDTGDYPIRLDANESYLSPPPALVREITAAVEAASFNRYPDPLATGTCRAFADYYGIDPRYVTAGNGSDELLYLISCCFAGKGDRILTVAPDFSMYAFYAYLAECETVTLKKNRSLLPDVDELIDECNRRDCKILVFSNPCNPTSTGLDREEVRRILTGVKALVVLDEAYMDFDDQSLIREAPAYDNLLLLRTCSKMMGMAALRMGFAVANDTITKALRSAKSPYNVNSLSQAAASAVLRQHAYLDDCRRKIRQSRDALYAALLPLTEENGWEMPKPRTNFVFLKPGNAGELFSFLKGKGILVRRIGEHLRITAGSEAENAALVSAVEEYSGNC